MKKTLFLFSVMFLTAAGCTMQRAATNPANDKTACTLEAMSCPDGSSVGRTGPSCEFAACPPVPAVPTQQDSGIQGTSFISPVCPVEKNPPDPGCNPKPYQATIIVKTSNGQTEVTRFTTMANGQFKVKLNPGAYLLVSANSSESYPRGTSQQVVVQKNKFTQVTITFDSGMR
jgi:hypothetical protein